MARTFHSLTYSHPNFEYLTNIGPRINILLTKFSQNEPMNDNIMIPGAKSSATVN